MYKKKSSSVVRCPNAIDCNISRSINAATNTKCIKLVFKFQTTASKMENNELMLISAHDQSESSEDLRRVNERQANAELWCKRKRRWIGHVFRHDSLLHEITEGRLTGELTIGRRRIQMLNGSERTTVMLHSNDQQRTENDGDRGGRLS